MKPNDLRHYGVLGMHWGVRKPESPAHGAYRTSKKGYKSTYKSLQKNIANAAAQNNANLKSGRITKAEHRRRDMAMAMKFAKNATKADIGMAKARVKYGAHMAKKVGNFLAYGIDAKQKGKEQARVVALKKLASLAGKTKMATVLKDPKHRRQFKKYAEIAAGAAVAGIAGSLVRPTATVIGKRLAERTSQKMAVAIATKAATETIFDYAYLM